MKFLFQLLFCSTILFFGFHFTACESSPKIVKQTDTSAKEYTSAYTCPMKCVGSGSDKPGKCPACKMEYTLNETKAAPPAHHGHDHGSHEGHDHGSHEGHDHGSHEGHNH